MKGGGRIAFVGDVHLDEGDAALDDFVAFVEGLGRRCERVVLMGDLFNLWIARPETEGEAQRAVIRALARIREQGTRVRYVEGNRDYRIGRRHTGTAFDDVAEEGLVESWGPRSIYAVHGDLANAADRQYRMWRRFSRSGFVWGLFGVVPRTLRRRLAERVELRFRSTNRAFKQELPEETIRSYAEAFVRRGHDTVVLGHFHVEREWELDGGGRVFILPEWRESRRHLEVASTGETSFVDS